MTSGSLNTSTTRPERDSVTLTIVQLTPALPRPSFRDYAKTLLSSALKQLSGLQRGTGLSPSNGKALDIQGFSSVFCRKAGEGNRTLTTSLEGWGSTIELRPRSERRVAGSPNRGWRAGRARASCDS